MANQTCPICTQSQLSTEDEHAMAACARCAKTIGIIAMPPSRRPPVPCARCNARQFVRVIPREHTSTRVGDINTQLSVPMYITHAPTVIDGWLGRRPGEVEVENTGHGLLETYICRKCGAVEWYCIDVDRIPIHPHLMSEAIDYESGSPYR
jgi:hypothetical protein